LFLALIRNIFTEPTTDAFRKHKGACGNCRFLNLFLSYFSFSLVGISLLFIVDGITEICHEKITAISRHFTFGWV